MAALRMEKRVLAFGTHPDDVEFMCAGTLALLAARGFEIHMAVMAGGEMGSCSMPPEQIRVKRLEECRVACRVIGAHFHCAGVRDLEVEYNDSGRQRAVRIVREARPSIIFAPPPMDYLIDHEETSRLVRNAAFIASVPNYDCGTRVRPMKRIPHLYYWNAVGLKDIFGRTLPLTCATDITSTMKTKTRMLQCHASQREWLKHISGFDQYTETMKKMAEVEGARAGFRTAEGFIQHVGSAYPQNNVLKEILQNLCREY